MVSLLGWLEMMCDGRVMLTLGMVSGSSRTGQGCGYMLAMKMVLDLKLTQLGFKLLHATFFGIVTAPALLASSMSLFVSVSPSPSPCLHLSPCPASIPFRLCTPLFLPLTLLPLP